MITTESLINGLQRETDIIKHIASKVSVDKLDWRPTPTQRSLGELLHYLTACAITPAYAMVDGNWDRGKAAEEELTAQYSFETFEACMDRQMDRLHELLSPITPDEAMEKTTTLPWGEEVPLGVALIEAVWKCFCTYRVTLFITTKESGVPLTSHNLWMGRDAEPAQA